LPVRSRAALRRHGERCRRLRCDRRVGCWRGLRLGSFAKRKREHERRGARQRGARIGFDFAIPFDAVSQRVKVKYPAAIARLDARPRGKVRRASSRSNARRSLELAAHIRAGVARVGSVPDEIQRVRATGARRGQQEQARGAGGTPATPSASCPHYFGELAAPAQLSSSDVRRGESGARAKSSDASDCASAVRPNAQSANTRTASRSTASCECG